MPCVRNLMTVKNMQNSCLMTYMGENEEHTRLYWFQHRCQVIQYNTVPAVEGRKHTRTRHLGPTTEISWASRQLRIGFFSIYAYLIQPETMASHDSSEYWRWYKKKGFVIPDSRKWIELHVEKKSPAIYCEIGVAHTRVSDTKCSLMKCAIKPLLMTKKNTSVSIARCCAGDELAYALQLLLKRSKNPEKTWDLRMCKSLWLATYFEIGLLSRDSQQYKQTMWKDVGARFWSQRVSSATGSKCDVLSRGQQIPTSNGDGKTYMQFARLSFAWHMHCYQGDGLQMS